jgi:anti-sigma regulatory factor (Ser/Thr protein kinase)
MIREAAEERRRASALQQQSLVLRRQSERLSAEIADRLRTVSGRPHGERGESFALRLARLRPAVGLMRHELGRWLERRNVDSAVAFEIALACSEACANAVEHPFRPARQAFEVAAAERDGEVEVVIRDFGRWRAPASSPDRGRGLLAIRALMDDVQLTNDDDGTRLAMRRRLPAQPSAAPPGSASKT